MVIPTITAIALVTDAIIIPIGPTHVVIPFAEIARVGDTVSVGINEVVTPGTDIVFVTDSIAVVIGTFETCPIEWNALLTTEVARIVSKRAADKVWWAVVDGTVMTAEKAVIDRDTEASQGKAVPVVFTRSTEGCVLNDAARTAAVVVVIVAVVTLFNRTDNTVTADSGSGIDSVIALVDRVGHKVCSRVRPDINRLVDIVRAAKSCKKEEANQA